jgi:hypothetical protein
MEEYLTNRIKALEVEQIDAISKSEYVTAEKIGMAIIELMDAKNEYRKIQLSK